MKKDLIKKLAKNSFVEDKIHPKIVKYVMQNLSKSDLREYVFFLKKELKSKIVYVKTSQNPTIEQKKEVENMYKNKKIIYEEDKTLGVSMIIKDDDKVIDASFKGLIDRTIDTLKH